MSIRRLKKVVQCNATTSKGTRCNRYCAPGELLCAKHDPLSLPAGIIATQDPFDAMAELRRLMRDRDSRVRLRAVAHYLTRLEREKKECPRCAANAASVEDNGQIVEYASASQRDALRRLITEVQSIKTSIRAHIAAGGGKPQEETSYGNEQQHSESPGEAPDLPTASVERAATASTAPADNDVVMVWRDGALRPEPRSARAWKEVRS